MTSISLGRARRVHPAHIHTSCPRHSDHDRFIVLHAFVITLAMISLPRQMRIHLHLMSFSSLNLVYIYISLQVEYSLIPKGGLLDRFHRLGRFSVLHRDYSIQPQSNRKKRFQIHKKKQQTCAIPELVEPPFELEDVDSR